MTAEHSELSFRSTARSIEVILRNLRARLARPDCGAVGFLIRGYYRSATAQTRGPRRGGDKKTDHRKVAKSAKREAKDTINKEIEQIAAQVVDAMRAAHHPQWPNLLESTYQP
jgi:hypothetical protein